MITTVIEVDAPPHIVRSIFLDFHNLSSWHNLAWLKSFVHQPQGNAPQKTSGLDLVPGDKIITTMSTMSILQTIEVNSTTEFRTRGPWYGILTGIHSYQWYPSNVIPGGTTMVQEEEFEGLLAFFMKPGMPGGKKTREGFEALNEELKSRAEEVAKTER